jgi:hypothetical protein
VTSLLHKNVKICCVHLVVATISWPIIAEFHCCPVYGPECCSWSPRSSKDLAPRCKSKVPSCVSLIFHYTKQGCEAIHSFIQCTIFQYCIHKPLYTALSTTTLFAVGTIFPCDQLHQQQCSFVSSIFSENWTVSLDCLNIFLRCHSCLTVLEIFSSHVEKIAGTSFSPPKCTPPPTHTQNETKK